MTDPDLGEAPKARHPRPRWSWPQWPARFYDGLADWLLADLDQQSSEIHNRLIHQSLTKPKAVLIALLSCSMVAVIAVAMTAAWWAYALLLALVALSILRLLAMQALLRAEAEGRNASVMPSALAGISFYTAVAIGCAQCVVSGQWLLILMAGIGLAVLIGGIASRDAGTPRYAALLIAVLILPFAAAALCSPIPYLFLVGLQLPFAGCGVIFVMLENYRVLLHLYQSEQENRRLAHHDPLTGLANRAQNHKHFEKLLAGLHAAHGRLRQEFMVFCLDLDGFKGVNDRYGHFAGDALLAAVARRLTASVRPMDSVARIGGDEFVILLPAITQTEAETIADRIIAQISTAFDVGVTQPVHIGVSIGCAAAPDDGDSAEHLLRSADRALYEAKRRGRGRFVAHGAMNVVELVPAIDADARMAKYDQREAAKSRTPGASYSQGAEAQVLAALPVLMLGTTSGRS